MGFLLLIFAILLLGIVYIWSIYNNLVTLRLRVKEAWSQIDVQLQRRADLIPNLVESVKGYVKHEKQVLENVTKARSALLSATGPKAKASANDHLVSALKTLFAVAENYPQLKANENFMQLQKELSDTEDKVAFARQFYNTAIADYNTRIQVFPNVFLAKYFGFREQEFFEVKQEDKNKIKVNFT